MVLKTLDIQNIYIYISPAEIKVQKDLKNIVKWGSFEKLMCQKDSWKWIQQPVISGDHRGRQHIIELLSAAPVDQQASNPNSLAPECLDQHQPGNTRIPTWCWIIDKTAMYYACAETTPLLSWKDETFFWCRWESVTAVQQIQHFSSNVSLRSLNGD